jgi:hypothetical protein
MLAGEIGGAIGGGIQSEGVLAVAKHYVANNFEWLPTGEGSFRADPLPSTCGCEACAAPRSIWSRSAGPWFGTA